MRSITSKTTSPFAEQSSLHPLRTLVGTADDAAISCAAQYVVGESGFPGEPSSIAAYENPFSAWHKSRGYAAV